MKRKPRNFNLAGGLLGGGRDTVWFILPKERITNHTFWQK